MDTGAARGVLDLLPGGGGPAQRDVVAHAGMDQAHFLQYEANAPVKLRALDSLEICAAQRDTPFIGVEESQQQPCQRGFARARRTDDGGDSAGFQGEADAGQRPALRAIGIAHVLEPDFMAIGDLLLAGRQGLQYRCLQQRLHALGGAHGAAQVMQQRMQQQHRRAYARRHQRKRQHVHGRHPAQPDEQGARGQHHAQHGDRRDHCMGVRHRRHQRTSKTGESCGKGVDGLAVAAMRLARVAERLDHGHAAHELDRCAIQAPEPFDELLHVRPPGLHGPAQEQEEAGERQQRHQRQAPVLHEQVDDRNRDAARGAPNRRVEMRGQAVQRADVVLHRLLDLARRPVGEPSQRHLRQPLRGGQAQVVRKTVIGQMGRQFAGRDQRHANEHGCQTGNDSPPDSRPGVRACGRLGAGEGDTGNVRNSRQRHQGEHGARRGQRCGGHQLPAYRGQHQA